MICANRARVLAGLVLLAGLLLLPQVSLGLSTVPFLEGLFQPVRLVSPMDDGRLFVVEQGGRIKVFSASGEALGMFLDISGQVSTGGERGLLGLAFPPDYATSGVFYVNYTDNGGDTRVDAFQVDPADPNQALVGSGTLILTVDQPFSNHNGGHLEFGPDGMLYIGLGDGGSWGDPDNYAQNGQSLLGKMLRLGVDGTEGYAIPADNPFLDSPVLDEIWATGLRNPWCFSFDRQTGDLWIADVGQNVLEEIDFQPATSMGGENYGWRLMEGTDCYNPSSDCNDGSLVLPLYEYAHGGDPFRCSISGGHVHRGGGAPELIGQYLFSDYCSNQIWALARDSQTGAVQVTDITDYLAPAGGFQNIVAFGQDAQGDSYIVDWSAGVIYKIQGDASPVDLPPSKSFLSQNVPNPFNPSTTIAYGVPRGDTLTRLEIHDLAGNLVKVLVSEVQPAGQYTATWDGTDRDGRPQAAGVYFYRLSTGEVNLSRKLVLLK